MTPTTDMKLAVLRAEVERLRNQLTACRAQSKALEQQKDALTRQLIEARKERER